MVFSPLQGIWSEAQRLTVDTHYHACHYIVLLFSLGPKAVMNGITADHKKKVLAAFLEKCPEQYTM